MIQRAVERVQRICRSHDDARSLRVAAIEEIRKAVGFDAYAWLLTDPESEVGCAPLADVPWVSELPRQIRLKYLTTVNRWTALGDPPVARLRDATGERPQESLVWRDFLADHGVTDVASVVFRDRFGCWAFLELWRTGGDQPFTADDATFLAAVAGPVTEELRRCEAITFRHIGAPAEGAGPVVLMLSPDLEVRAQTAQTEHYLRLLVPPDADRRPIPAGAYNVAAQLLAVEAGVDDHPPSARVHLADGVWLTLQAARIGDTTGSDIAVTIERTTPTERLDVFMRASGLTPREVELVTHLVAGADTREVAERMFLSEHTVQDHLKSIFNKTGTQNRRALLVRATGR